jgi:hypothetical protein
MLARITFTAMIAVIAFYIAVMLVGRAIDGVNRQLCGDPAAAANSSLCSQP